MVTFLVVLAASMLAGANAGLSVIAGGGSVILGSLAAFLVMRNKQQQDAGSVLVKLLKAEAVKIFVIALTLLLVFKVYVSLVPLALMAGLGAAALLSGAAVFSIKEKSEI